MKNPHRLFLFDALGAAFTFLTVGVMGSLFYLYVGFPLYVMITLGAMALIFMIHSFTAYIRKFPLSYLKRIAQLNLLYVFLLGALMAVYREQLQPLPALYFIAEIVVLVFLSSFERKIVLTER